MSDLEQLLEIASLPTTRTVLVIGNADSGKTTLIERLGRELCRREECWGLVDADIGQSHLGPPATVAWSRIESGFTGWSSLTPATFYFTGAVSPAGHLLPLLAGTKLMAEAALAQCDKVLIDTTGLVAPPLGPVLKHHKIDLLAPDLVIAIECRDELEPILSPLRRQARPRVHRLTAAPARRSRSAEERARYRAERFHSYFAGAGLLRLDLDRIGLRFSPAPGGTPAGRLVSLRDSANRDLALGIIEPGKSDGLLVQTPWEDAAAVATVIVGAIEITP